MSKIKICALGGLNEIGKNMYIVEVDEDIFIFEAGLKYATDMLYGVDYMIPNYDYLIENQDRIVGLFVSHGHDAQIGAIADILNDIPNLKIFASKFTIEIIKQDLTEEQIKNTNLIELEMHKSIRFKNNSIFPVQISHALPESTLFVLNTQDGAIVFTGNYLFDPSMTGPYKTDIGKLAYIGKQGVLCLMSESMYSEKAGFTAPMHETKKKIREILDKNNGRILFNIFENQIFRIQELFDQVMKTDRNIVIMGKKLENIILKAIDLNYVNFDKNRIKSIHNVNDEGIIVIISNEQEKPYSNLKRILRNSDKFISLTNQDTVVIASPIYEGIEITSTNVFNQIAQLGSKLIIFDKKYLSPHASSEDLMMMISLMQPKYYFPINGEYRHQVENANLAKRLGYDDQSIILTLNGTVTKFENGVRVSCDEKIKTDEILIDGKTIGDIGDLVLKDREMLGENGIVIVTANLDKTTKTIINKPQIFTRGFIYVKDNIDMIKEAELQAMEIIEDNVRENFVDFNKIKINIRERLGKYFYKETDSKPMIIVCIQEV